MTYVLVIYVGLLAQPGGGASIAPPYEGGRFNSLDACTQAGKETLASWVANLATFKPAISAICVRK